MDTIGSKILAAAQGMHEKGQHPRILLTEADFARFLENKENGICAKIVQRMISLADAALELAPCKYEIPDGKRLLRNCRIMQARILHCSLAYRFTGEEKYALRAVREIEAAASFPDWNPQHYLDVATLCQAFACAYDWLYGYLSEETKALMRRAIITFGLKTAMDDYTDRPDRVTRYRWYQDDPGDNWKLVCNGAIALAVLAIFDDEACELYEPCLTYGFEDSYRAVRDFYDPADGTYSEGVGYWEYATQYLAYYSKGLFTVAGSDFGLTDWDGVRRSPYFVLSMSSPDSIAFNFGDARADSVASPILSWCAERYEDSALYGVRRGAIEKGRITYDDAIFFRDVEEAPLSELPLAFGRVGGDNATFRSDVSENASFAAIHFAKNHAYHGHRDMGTFVVNAGGKRFFMDLGPDNYNLSPYRYCYRTRAEGHNTVIFNPSPENDQEYVADCEIHRFSGGEESYAISDISSAYLGKSVIRGLKLDRRDKSVLVQDEICCEKEDKIRWSAHTAAAIRLYEGGKSAVLDIGGVKMYVAILTDGVFEIRASCPDENSPVLAPAHISAIPDPVPQEINSGVQRLMIRLSGKECHRIAVWLYPLTEGREIPTEKPPIKPLSVW